MVTSRYQREINLFTRLLTEMIEVSRADKFGIEENVAIFYCQGQMNQQYLEAS